MSSCGGAGGANGGCKDQCSAFSGLPQDFLGKLVGEGAAGARTPGRIEDGSGANFLPGLVDNCLNSDSSD